MGSTVEHPGIVDAIKEDGLRVRILAASACASCHAKGACSMADMAEKFIDVPHEQADEYQIGQRVNVVMKIGAGNRAVLLGYFFPLLVLVFTLFTAFAITGKEGLSGMLSVLILVPYYFILWLNRERIKKKTEFTVY